MTHHEAGHLQGREVVIVEAARTPIGRGHRVKGWFRDVHPNELLGGAYQSVIQRAGIDAGLVQNVVAGCVTQVGEQSSNIARNAWLQAGLPMSASASTVDLKCGSSQQAFIFATGLIAGGIHDVVIAAGVEHMGRIPMGSYLAHPDEFGTPHPPELLERYQLVLLERNGMTIDDLDLIEINEAFASVVCACRRELKPDMDRVNVNGGALALGHPLGSSGARLITTLLHELERSDGEFGLVTMCTAGGTGTGTILQRV